MVSLVLGLIGMALTLIIELGYGWLVGYKAKEDRQKIFRVNVITQIILILATGMANYVGGLFSYLFVLLIMEVLILIGEFIAYARLFEKQAGRLHPVIYGITANLLSFFSGIFIMVAMVTIF